MKIWGQFNDKIKKSWLSYVLEIENVTSAYFAVLVFIEFVSRYVMKKKAEIQKTEGDKSKNTKTINLDNYKYVSNNEQMRLKQEKLNELIGGNDNDESESFSISTRRKRLRRGNHKKNDNLNEQVILLNILFLFKIKRK